MIILFNAFMLQYLKFAQFKFAQNATALYSGSELYTICALQCGGQRVSPFSSILCTWKYRLNGNRIHQHWRYYNANTILLSTKPVKGRDTTVYRIINCNVDRGNHSRDVTLHKIINSVVGIANQL